jgi:hypothetical protein
MEVVNLGNGKPVKFFFLCIWRCLYSVICQVAVSKKHNLFFEMPIVILFLFFLISPGKNIR